MIQAEAAPTLTRTSLRDQAYMVIRQWILTGRLAPGAQVSERSIAEQLGVSRAPIKDALLRLTREGFVVSRPDGRYVKEFGWREMDQIYRVRERLESLAAELAAAHASPTRVSDLLARLEDYRAACRARDLDGFVTADMDIHTTIWHQADNPYLLNALSCIAAPTFMHVADCARYVDDEWTIPLREHEAIVAHIAEGNPAGAGSAMTEHVRSAYARTMRVFQEDASPCGPAPRGEPIDRIARPGAAER